ncbi:tetratricopeptide repeat protein [Leptolyngbya sp. PCC 6406]|uniref:tetratricopeptide repeat protein n=1 Tax=Leptolyngbya sp. PCC 6406 TaxID=1173264 RepID=UPI0002AC26BC|nr:tetratricopeptide repeat protein [Leptolyngbya sp. PCC 6406]
MPYRRSRLCIDVLLGQPRLTRPNYGETLTKLGQYDQALTSLETGLRISQEQGARSLEAAAYKYLGLLHQAMDHRERAADYFDQAIAVALKSPLAIEYRELRSALTG